MTQIPILRKSDPDAEDLALLRAANEQGLVALPLGSTPAAMTRAHAGDWLRLVDVGPVAGQPGAWRVFKLTFQGRERLKKLRDRR